MLAGEVIDSTAMDVAALRSFLAEQIRDAKEQGVLFSLHLKATMMKVSDPIIFGHAVEVFFADVFAKHGDAIAAAGGDPRNGWASVLSAVESLPADQRARSRPTSLRPTRPAPTSRWSTPTRASPTCTCRAT